MSLTRNFVGACWQAMRNPRGYPTRCIACQQVPTSGKATILLIEQRETSR